MTDRSTTCGGLETSEVLHVFPGDVQGRINPRDRSLVEAEYQRQSVLPGDLRKGGLELHKKGALEITLHTHQFRLRVLNKPLDVDAEGLDLLRALHPGG